MERQARRRELPGEGLASLGEGGIKVYSSTRRLDDHPATTSEPKDMAEKEEVKMRSTLEPYLVEAVQRLVGAWLGMEFEKKSAEKVAGLLGALAEAQVVLMERGVAWAELVPRINGALKKKVKKSQVDHDFAAVVLQFMAPIQSKEVWNSICEQNNETRKSFDVGSADHVLCGLFYGLTAMWVYYSKSMMREMAYFLSHAEESELEPIVEIFQTAVLETLELARYAPATVVQVHVNATKYDLKFDDGETIQASADDVASTERCRSDASKGATSDDEDDEEREAFEVGDRVRVKSRVVHPPLDGASLRILNDSWLSDLFRALVDGPRVSSPSKAKVDAVDLDFKERFESMFDLDKQDSGEEEREGPTSWSDLARPLLDRLKADGALEKCASVAYDAFSEHPFGDLVNPENGDNTEAEYSLLALEVSRALFRVSRDRTWVRAFAEPMRTCKTLNKLSLACCMIRDTGAAVVADALKGSAIELLDVRVNLIGPAGIEALADSIRVGPLALSELNLEGNCATNEAFDGLLTAIQDGHDKNTSPKLMRLLISDLSKTYKGYAAVPEAEGDAGPHVGASFDTVPESAGKLNPKFSLHCRQAQIKQPPHDVVFPNSSGLLQDTDQDQLGQVSLESVASYYERLREASGTDTTVKLALVGLGTAGKTSLSNALRKSADSETNEYCTKLETRTVGIDVSTWIAETEKTGEDDGGDDKSRPEAVTFQIWDYAGQGSYGLTHQFFLGPDSLNVIIVDVNRYSLSDNADGRIDVVAYQLLQEGYDVREALPTIKGPILESDRIYRACWDAECEGNANFEDMDRLLKFQDKASYAGKRGRVLLTHDQAREARVLGNLDALLQTEKTYRDLDRTARLAQVFLKKTLAGDSEWATTVMDAAFTETHGKEEATKRRLATRQTCPGLACPHIAAVYDPGTKTESRVKEKALFKYKGRFERVRDIARLAVQCDDVAALLRTLDYLVETFTVLEISNRFCKPTALGWRDLQLLVEVECPLRLGQNEKNEPSSSRSSAEKSSGVKHICEIQLQLKSFAIARQSAHHFYRVLRSNLQDALKTMPGEIDRVQHLILDRVTNSVSDAEVFDREVQSWIDILQNRTASSEGARFVMVATKVDLCSDTFESKAAAMLERVRSAERTRRQAIQAEIEALENDESVVNSGAMKQHRLFRGTGGIKAAALSRVAKKRKQEFRRLLKTRPVLLGDTVYCVSAKTGVGIDDLRRALVATAANTEIFPHFGGVVPKSDLDLAGEVDALRTSGTPYVPKPEFMDLAQKKCGIRQKDVPFVIGAMIRRGKILHFLSELEENTPLSQLIFCDNQWIINVLREVVRHDLKTLLSHDENELLLDGVIARSTFRRLWSRVLGDNFEVVASALEALLVQFEIAFPLTDLQEKNAKYLVPLYLPEAPPESLDLAFERAGPRYDDRNVSVTVRAEFPFSLPVGFFERCLIRLRRLLKTQAKSKAGETSEIACWNSGLLCGGVNPWLRFELTSKGTFHVVDITGRCAVGGDKDTNASYALTSAWAIVNSAKYVAGELLTDWPGCVYALKIPCPSCLKLGKPNAAVWAIEEFVHCDSQSTIHCDICQSDVPIRLCTPPLEAALKDVRRCKKIAKVWKSYQRRCSKKASTATPPPP